MNMMYIYRYMHMYVYLATHTRTYLQPCCNTQGSAVDLVSLASGRFVEGARTPELLGCKQVSSLD